MYPFPVYFSKKIIGKRSLLFHGTSIAKIVSCVVREVKSFIGGSRTNQNRSHSSDPLLFCNECYYYYTIPEVFVRIPCFLVSDISNFLFYISKEINIDPTGTEAWQIFSRMFVMATK